jgi:hypothetical protein
LRDRDTGKPREFDVLISWDHGHHRIITAIECKDRSRPIGVPDVEAFADKCQSTGVHAGVMVSAKGFRQTARTKAAARSITCMDLEEVEQFHWLGLETIDGYVRQFGHIDVRIMFNDGMPDALQAVFDEQGNELPEDALVRIVQNAVPAAENPDDEVGVTFPVNMHLNTPGWTARAIDGKIWQVDHLLVRGSFETVKTVSVVKSHRYSGGGKDYAIASAGIEIAGTAGRIVFVRNEDESTDVFWTPDKHGAASVDKPDRREARS